MIEGQYSEILNRARPGPAAYLCWLVFLLLFLPQGLHAQPYVYYTTLVSFPPSDPSGLHNGAGSAPEGELVQTPDGTFYGVAAAGGPNGNGTVFSFKAGTLSAIYSFSAFPSGVFTNADGAKPLGGLVLGSDGNLYGTTSLGGANGAGTIFRISAAGILTTLHSFSSVDAGGHNSDGSQPYGKLVQTADGTLFGTTRFGGSGATGTVFKITASGTFTKLYSFLAIDSSDANATGAEPASGLVLASDGSLYGTAELGGANGVGTLFKITPQGNFTLLHTFSATPLDTNADGARPAAAMMQASDGYFYGTTQYGGSQGYGTVFRQDASGNLTTLYSFNSLLNGATFLDGPVHIDGTLPAGPLLEGPDGNLYGATSQGGEYSSGTIFSISPAGNYSLLFHFGPAGIGPSSGLIRGLDGQLYGVTVGGSAALTGTIYTLVNSTNAPISLSLSPSTVHAGDQFTATWSSPGAYYCTNGQNLPATGSVTANSPGVPGLLPFFLWCANIYGQAMTFAIETILPPLPTVSISVAPSSITLASTATLTWAAANVSACTASGSWSGARDPYGTASVTPPTTGVSTYTLTCTGPGGTAAASAKLTVTAATKPVITMSVSPAETTVGSSPPTLSWSTTSAQTCTASGAWTGSQPTSGNIGFASLAAGNYTYTLACTGPGGTTSASASLKIDPVPGKSGGGGTMSFMTLLGLAGVAVLRLTVLARRSE